VTCRFEESELLIALFCGALLAGGFWLCARAPVAANASTAAMMSEWRMAFLFAMRWVYVREGRNPTPSSVLYV
jgi:hypothetical protein